MRLQAYDYITDLPRWHLHGGRDFIFFDPHPGFALGTAAYSFREAWCQQLRDAIQLVPDSFGRSHCLKPDSMPSQLVPVPYVRFSSSRLSLWLTHGRKFGLQHMALLAMLLSKHGP